MNVNYSYLLNINYKKGFFIGFIALCITWLLICFSLLYSHDTYITYGIYDGFFILIDIPIDNSDAVNEDYYLKLEDKKYRYKVIDVSSLLTKDYINYQTYKIKINNNNLELNEVVKITFYYNKQRVIQKIMKIIF